MRPFAVVAIVTLTVAIWGRPAPPKPHEPSSMNDARHWSTFVEHLAAGQPYYETAVSDYHAHGYPTFSVANFRQPMLYRSLAWLGVPLMLGLRAGLVLLLILRAWQLRGWLCGLTVAHACLFVVAPVSVYFAEPWAGVLIGLSLLAALRGDTRLAVGWAVVGLFVRELVVPYCVVMVAIAAARYRWRDVALWMSGGVFWLTAYAAHASNAMAVMPAGELVSYSYWYFGGVPLLLKALMFHGLLPLFPWWMAVPVVSLLALAGLSRSMPAELRWTGIAYAVMLLCLGQPFNYYWGALIAPVFACWLPYGWHASRSSLRHGPVSVPFPRQSDLV